RAGDRDGSASVRQDDAGTDTRRATAHALSLQGWHQGDALRHARLERPRVVTKARRRHLCVALPPAGDGACRRTLARRREQLRRAARWTTFPGVARPLRFPSGTGLLRRGWSCVAGALSLAC